MSRRSDLTVIAAAGVLLLVTACGGNDSDQAVPRPTAWPRIATYAADYDTLRAPELPVAMAVNRHATVTVKPAADGSVGADIVYPAYGTTVYVTAVKGLDNVDDFGRAWLARTDRAYVNLGGVPAQKTTAQSPDGNAYLIYRATGTSPTPVQLLAGNPRHGVIVSATAFINAVGNSTPYDSIRPVVDALAADLTNMAKSLTYK